MKSSQMITAFASLALLAACISDPETAQLPPRALPQTSAELAFAKATLSAVQQRSFDEDREFCGYIGVNASGEFVASAAKRGRRTTCTPRAPRGDVTILASYHSHGAFAEDYDSERPSYDDIAADIDEEIDGYISTPGGRFWYIDSSAKEARLICGPSCVIADPSYVPDWLDPVEDRYTLQDLAEREGY